MTYVFDFIRLYQIVSAAKKGFQGIYAKRSMPFLLTSRHTALIPKHIMECAGLKKDNGFISLHELS